MTPRIDHGDFENELRDLFREKAGQAPLATPSLPASAPRQVLRRGRIHQVGTVLGSMVVVIALILGSVAGLTRILGEGEDRVGGDDYEIFQRTATVEAFTVTSPSDWYLVNHWPASIERAVSSNCPGTNQDPAPLCHRYPGMPSPGPEIEAGSPMLQLTNHDLGLEATACDGNLPADRAALYVAFDYSRALAGISDPSIQVFPPGEPGLPPVGDGPCGPGRYASFTVNGEPFFSWIGVGSDVSDEDRDTVETSYEMMSAILDWTPTPPDVTTPAYVIAGGASENGEPWRLDLRPGERSPELFLEGVDRSLLGAETGRGIDSTVPAVPIAFCCAWTDGLSDATFLDVTFGFVRKDASGVELHVREGEELTGQIMPGTIVPVPPSLGSFDFDLFFIPGTAGVAGQVVPVGIEGTEEPPPAAEPRTDEVELAGDAFGQRYRVRFIGSFADDTACIRVTVDGAGTEPLCPRPIATSLGGDQPSLHVVNTGDLAVVVGSVPSEVGEIRFTSDTGDATTPSQFQCQMGPLGWTDPDRKVCAIALPPEDGGTFEYFDSAGGVLFEEGMGWFSAQGEPVAPKPVDPVHGGTYWAVYPWVGAPGDREAEDVSAWLLEEFGIEAFPGDLACDEGAAVALGTNAEQGIGVYFETDDEANAFAQQAGLLDHTRRVIARVTTYCLD